MTIDRDEGRKMSEQPGFANLPAYDREKILKAEAKRERKRKRHELSPYGVRA